MKTEEMIGKKYGKWEIIGREKGKKGYDLICKCECGKIKIHKVDNIKNGRSTMCRECRGKSRKKEKKPRIVRMRIDSNKEWSEENTFIGTYKDYLKECAKRRIEKKEDIEQKRKEYREKRKIRRQIYTRYQKMKDRCLNEQGKNYENYGGRGIKICNEWLENFEEFYKWSMENGYKKELSIDRIDVNGNYEPNNCRWITMKEQQRNRRNNCVITYNGETKTLIEWSEEIGICSETIRRRLDKGIPIDKVMYKGRVDIQGRKKYKTKKKYEETKQYQKDRKKELKKLATVIKRVQVKKVLKNLEN